MIPDDAVKPGTPAEEAEPLPDVVKALVRQKEKNNHFGLYEYLQVNLAYSSCRMASNRMTRTQVLDLYRTGKVNQGFEATKAEDIISMINHFETCARVLDTVMKPLSLDYIRNIHLQLTYGTFEDRSCLITPGEFRRRTSEVRPGRSSKPERISQELGRLISKYERPDRDLKDILNFHVAFEEIRPFSDCNGRIGRLILMKECLRWDVDPFIIDDKRRRGYLDGIEYWKENPQILLETVGEAQERFRNQMETCSLFEYHRTRNPRKLMSEEEID